MSNFFIPIRNENEKQCSRTLIILDFVAELFYTMHFDFDDSLLSKAALKTKPVSTKWRQKARIFGEKGNKNLLSNVKTQHYKKNIKNKWPAAKVEWTTASSKTFTKRDDCSEKSKGVNTPLV